MKNNKSGFTLIELLVVVLIIGILAAIALPSYQLAVDKARFMQMVVGVDAIAKAEETFYASKGDYTENLDALNVSMNLAVSGNYNYTYVKPGEFWITLKGIKDPNGRGRYYDEHYLYGQDLRTGTQYVAFLNHQEEPNASAAGHRYCKLKNNNTSTDRSRRLCKALGTQATSNVGQYSNFDHWYRMK